MQTSVASCSSTQADTVHTCRTEGGTVMPGEQLRKKYHAWKKHQPEKPIFRTILFSMLAVLVAESILLWSAIRLTNVSGRLNENAKDILDMQVDNRASYIQDMMRQAQDLTALSDSINQTTQQMLDEGIITRESMDDGTAESDPLLTQIAPQLVSTLRTKSVTGIFIVLNTEDLNTREVGSSMPGIYLRDMDPDARPSDRDADLMLERASAAVIKCLGITSDKGWQPMLSYQGQKSNGFVRSVYQAAYSDAEKLNPEDYGRWTTSTYSMVADNRTAIAYSQPLILDDGTVYGVLGVEMLTSYLETKIPYAELQQAGHGTYFLASTTAAEGESEMVLTRSAASSEEAAALDSAAASIHCTRDADGLWMDLGGKHCYAHAVQLELYSRNAPFSHERWMLVGAVDCDTLFSFSHTVGRVLTVAMLLTLLLGVAGSLLVSHTLAHPTEQLYREVVAAQNAQTFPQLSHTGIRELDRFAQAITQLNSSLITNSTKFLRIMDMASVELGGYELRYDTGSVFATDNFFALLGAPEVDVKDLTIRTFEELLNRIQFTRPCRRTVDGDRLLTIRQDGVTRYIMLRVTTENHVQVGLAEDVTATTLERMRIEHERDYDILTGLYNRQAFQRVCEELFENPERLGVAALLMLDLDNLKHINDTYGHDWGDQYIHRTGQCIARNTPTGTVCARLSGDEFMLLFYGYRSQEQLRAKIDTLGEAMRQSVAVLPSGSALHISISGGIAWYPADGRDMATLKKYADFAMYQVKHSEKGHMKDFDVRVYDQEAYAARTRREFQQLISEERVRYHFQPIFTARDGSVLAYEALMRSDLPTLRSPATIMKLAREQGALYEIEKLTFNKSLETFDQLSKAKLVSPDALLFINSIASVSLTRADSEYMDSRWHELRSRMVIEITEEEELDRKALEIKRHAPGFSGMFALDDYGSGYANEGSLLEIEPRFIKVDITIIRGIDTDHDKQQIVQNIVTYAHHRDMKIIAEGVETAAELQTVVELGVDALQGYFLARPAEVPDAIAPEALDLIRALRRKDADETEWIK